MNDVPALAPPEWLYLSLYQGKLNDANANADADTDDDGDYGTGTTRVKRREERKNTA